MTRAETHSSVSFITKIRTYLQHFIISNKTWKWASRTTIGFKDQIFPIYNNNNISLFMDI